MARVGLGDKVRDQISGYEGVAYATIQYLTGCDQIGIKPHGMKADGSTFDVLYFDEPFVEVVTPGMFAPIPNRQTGGPQPAIKRG